jgi:phosphatidylinositol-3-phosphatase
MKFFALGLLILSSMAWGQVPQSRHVWIVTEENHSYEAVIGNSSMPYFNSLVSKYGLATQYYAEQHNSISALMWLVAGQPVTGNNETTSCYAVNNVARQLIAQKYSWRSYQEDLPFAGFTGISYANYVRRHNPIIDFTDSCAAGQATNSVPFTELATDIQDHSTPNYAYITPNLAHDAHNGPLSAADLWLSQHLPAILALPEFKPGGDGLLFVVFDEADLSSDGVTQDNRCSSSIGNGCGGRLATLMIGPQVKPGYKSSVRYDHANLLRTVCDAMSFSSCPGAGAVANPMADFFNQVNIATPFPNAIVASPVHIQATAANQSSVIAMQIYVDNALKYQLNNTASVKTNLPMSIGSHFVVVQSWDSAGGIHKRGINVDVQSQAVVVKNPAPAAVVSSPVQISATGGGQKAINKMQLYVDGNAHFQSTGNTLNTSVSLAAGNHNLEVEASDSSGNLTTNRFGVTSATPAVHILSPAPNSSFTAPMFVSATTIDPTQVNSIHVFLDSKLVYQVSGTGVQAWLPITTGKHSLTVQATNKAGTTYKQNLNVTVAGIPITISSPTANATVTSPVTIKASAPSTSMVQTMQIYIDNALAYQVPGQTVSHAFTLGSGAHYVVAKGWDSSGNNWWSGENITVK